MFIVTLNRLIAKLIPSDQQSNDTVWAYGGDMPRTSRTTENVYAVDTHVLSQEDRPGTHRTIPGIDISRRK